MKRLIYSLCLGALLGAGQSCSKKADNYAEPSETLTGSIIDSTTGKPMQTEIGSGGIRLRLDEMSWSSDPTPYYFNTKQDGTFSNTKIFKATYRITPEGPFVPFLQNGSNGAITVDRRVTMDIAGTVKLDFTVQPFLKLEWVGEPVINTDGTITAKVKLTRGTSNPAFQNDVTELSLFINSSSPYVGNNNYDNRYFNQGNYSAAAGNALIGQTITLTTKGGALPGKRAYYIRAGARTSYGLKQFNYTDVKTVNVP